MIDDSKAMRLILTRIMQGLSYEVLEAADGQQAIERMEEGPLPDVALVDWNMPVMDGLEFVHAVRQHEGWRGVALMMVTTEGEKAQLVRALAAGADEYVVKPFTPDAIAEKLLLLGVSA